MGEPSTELLSRRQATLLMLLLLAFPVVLFLRTAWIAEDAFISFRTIDNLFHGYGLRWNPLERVQSFTHPLWLLLVSLAYLLTREFYYTVTLLSVGISAAVIWLLVYRAARTPLNALLAVAVLVFSKAFVDYSTSGLENPLTHLLLAGFLLAFLRLQDRPPAERTPRRIFALSLLAALAVLNRMDTLLLLAPALLLSLLQRPRRWRAWLAAAAGFSPFLLWELFSLLYYGFPFPNTAYAKLGTGIQAAELREQGFLYLLNSLSWDPLTLFAIGALTAYAVVYNRKQLTHVAVGAGVLLYLWYVVRIGGCFMSGRYLSAPLLACTVLLARSVQTALPQAALALVLVATLGLSGIKPPLRTNHTYKWDEIDDKGIADERGFYYPLTGLLTASRNKTQPNHTYCKTGRGVQQSGRKVTVEKNVGFMAYCAGPEVHMIDRGGLTDPLLARLPVETTRGGWRIGHFYRAVPDRYPEAAVSDTDLADADLNDYWQSLSLVTRGKIWSWARIKEIWRLNSGARDHWLDAYCRSNFFLLAVKELDRRREPGSPYDAPGNRMLGRHGAGLQLTYWKLAGRSFALGLNGGRAYDLLYLRGGQALARRRVRVPPGPRRGMVVQYLRAPRAAIEGRFDLLRLKPAGPPDRHSLGHFDLLPGVMVRRLDQLSTPRNVASPWNAAGNVLLGDRLLLVKLGRLRHARRLEISTDANDRHRVSFLRGSTEIGASILPRVPGAPPGMHVHRIRVPLEVARSGYDRLLVTALEGDRQYSVGHVLLR
jgi:arabinofuranosyltransferase